MYVIVSMQNVICAKNLHLPNVVLYEAKFRQIEDCMCRRRRRRQRHTAAAAAARIVCFMIRTLTFFHEISERTDIFVGRLHFALSKVDVLED